MWKKREKEVFFTYFPPLCGEKEKRPKTGV
jgi:hypothetical protein